MRQPPDHNLAELNIARLLADPGHPRVAPFMEALDRVNGIGKRSPGFIWIMEGSGNPGTGNTENSVRGDPRLIPNLTVWQDIASFEQFVWKTVHRQYFERRSEWFEPLGEQNFVMWWIPLGHIPTLDEGLSRLDHLKENGHTDHAFGWSHLKNARFRRQHAGQINAAE